MYSTAVALSNRYSPPVNGVYYHIGDAPRTTFRRTYTVKLLPPVDVLAVRVRNADYNERIVGHKGDGAQAAAHD